MSTTVGQGGTITLDAVYSDGTGTAVNPTGPTIEILDPNDVQQLAPTTPDRNPSTGRYEHDYTLAAGATLGAWTARWSGTINGVVVTGDDTFSVVGAGELEFSGDTLDVLTLNEAKTAINLETANTDHDTELEQFITAISRRLDDLCGPVVTRQVANELHDGGVHKFTTRVTPVSSIDTLVEYRSTADTTLTAETNGAKAADNYLLENDGHRVWVRRRRTGADSTFPSGRRNVDVTYTAGRYASTVSVDALFKQAAASILRRLWKRESSSWAQTPGYFGDVDDARPLSGFFKAVDPMVHELLADEIAPHANGLLVV